MFLLWLGYFDFVFQIRLYSLIVKVPIDVFKGITDEDAAKVVDGLAPKVADRNTAIEQVKKLYNLFCESDCTLLEVMVWHGINPVATTSWMH